MNRPIFSLWPYRVFLRLAVLALLGALLPPVGFALIILAWQRNRWLWRLTKQIRHFQTMADARLVLHYAPQLDSKDMPRLIRRCHAELDRLTEQFGSPLRGRPVVFLLFSRQDIAAIMGKPAYAGYALWHANAILIAADTSTPELIRHELGHLYSAQWNKLAPPLLCEGLSVWLQETERGQAIDTAVRPFLDNRNLKLVRLLNREFFLSEPQRYSCYVLAGSFTGFLIRRHGWEKFRDLYRMCKGTRFRAKFKKCFGVTLEKAEWQWRNEIIVMNILKSRMRRSVSF